MKTTSHTLAALAFAALAAPPLIPSLHAGSTQPQTAKAVTEPTKAEASVFDEIWKLATLYKNDQNPFLQELKLRGRYHGQYYWLDSDQGSNDAWEDRRSGFGIDAKLFGKKIELRIDAQSSDGFDPFYNGLVDAYIKWKPSDAFSLTLGRQKPQIGYYDFLQSTNNQPTYDLIPKKLQLVARYTFANGDGPDSVTAQGRYERTAPDLTGSGRGETYHAAYLGAQYFIYGDKLKVLAGAEYADLDGGGNGGDYNGSTFLTGVRVSF